MQCVWQPISKKRITMVTKYFLQQNSLNDNYNYVLIVFFQPRKNVISWKSLNVIMVIVISRLLSSLFKGTLYWWSLSKIIGYCYHSVNVIKNVRFQSDLIRRLPLYDDLTLLFALIIWKKDFLLRNVF